MFDPWTATLQEALEEDGRRNCTLPFRQFLVAQGVKKERNLVEAGNGAAIMGCMVSCLRYGLDVPEWLTKEFTRRAEAVIHGRAITWDDQEAFGKPHKKHVRKNAEYKRGERMLQAWTVAHEILKSDPAKPINGAFFEEIGELMRPPIGKTEAEKSYYAAKQIMDSYDQMNVDDIFKELTNPTNSA